MGLLLCLNKSSQDLYIRKYFVLSRKENLDLQKRAKNVFIRLVASLINMSHVMKD